MRNFVAKLYVTLYVMLQDCYVVALFSDFVLYSCFVLGVIIVDRLLLVTIYPTNLWYDWYVIVILYCCDSEVHLLCSMSVVEDSFEYLDAPIQRIAGADVCMC